MISGAELAMLAKVMMFREPVARIAEAVGKPRQIERVA
jgi:hypothetical protein